ncbi:kinase-like protein [Marasmius fiardii PR-910]|nr:kinase-like protein [Marasmius fiardii PR-910]
MIRPEELEIDENTPLCPQKTVYKAIYRDNVVAVKLLSQEVTPSNLHARTANWNSLIHPNVLRFIGTCSQDADPLYIVTEYQELGNAQEFLQQHPNADRPQLVLDVARGMQFLHSRSFIHGSLKTSDIVVNASGEACVADYCMAQIQASKSNEGHRYFSPEAWKGMTSKASDVYAFAMCAIEIFTSTPPWGVLPEKHIIRMVVHEDTRPDRPDDALSIRVGLNNQMWDIIEESWHKEPRLRPTFDIIVRLWQAAIKGDRKCRFNHSHCRRLTGDVRSDPL